MRWTHLAFFHWPLPADALRPLIPNALTLDTFDGSAWIGVVPFHMEGTQLRGIPPVPTAADFAEVNVRTYVRGAGRAGVWFLSLDAASRLAVWGARLALNLPYHHASMRIAGNEQAIEYTSRRITSPPDATLETSYGPTGDVAFTEPGSLEYWLTERYCLFGQRRNGKLYYLDVHHLPWPLQQAAAAIRTNTLVQAAGVDVPESPPQLVHFARSLDVWAWAPVSF